MDATPKEARALGALAGGIIPPDDRDDGVAALKADEHFVRKLAANPFASALLQDLTLVETHCVEQFGRSIEQLDCEAMVKLLAIMRDRVPALFKFVRMESCALYLSQPATWR